MRLSLGIRKRLYQRLVKTDQAIQFFLNHILPANLTTRYVLGLGLIALLAASGQALIQFSLDRQLETQRNIRKLDRQLPLIDEVRKTTFVLQLSSRKEEIEAQMVTIKSLLDRVQQARVEMSKSGVFSSLKTIDHSGSFEQSIIKLEDSLSSIIRSHSVAAKKFTPATQDLIESITVYQAMTKQSIRHFEGMVDSQVNRFKKTELFLFLASLFILLLEALYVFRPSVERLYGALRVRSDFLSKMSHELRNPMNSIIGMAHLLSETATTQQQKNYLSVLKRSSAGLLEMLNCLLDFSSLESGKLRLEKIKFNLYEVLERCLDLAVMNAQANKTELMLDIAEDVPLHVVGDPIRIQQIIFNLLGNAVKFTKNGTVTLQVQAVARKDRRVIKFSVIDTGIGIELERLNQIFEPFVQENVSIKRKFGGSGLGLSIVKELVDRMQGKLEVWSEKNQGSRFSFTIPFDDCDSPKLGTEMSGFHFPHFKALLLVRSDNAFASLKTILTSLNATVQRVSQAQDLLHLLDKERGVQNVLFAEHEEYERIFQGQHPDFLEKGKSVFILDSLDRSASAEKLGMRESTVLLFKPVRPLQVAEAVRQVLLGKSMNEEKVSPAQPAVETKPLKVLIAEDSRDNQLLLQAYLQNSPHTLTFVSDGEEAIDQFKAASFDLVIMDIEMPKLDGREATRLIRKFEQETNRVQKVPVLALSAYSQPDAQSEGFTGYLTKPVIASDLYTKIRELSMSTPNQPKPTSRISDAVANLNSRIARLIPNYLENRKKELSELKTFLVAHDYPSIERVGHKLKGNAASYGFDELGLIGAQLETSAKNSDHSQTTHLIGEIETFLQKVKPPVSTPEKFH